MISDTTDTPKRALVLANGAPPARDVFDRLREASGAFFCVDPDAGQVAEVSEQGKRNRGHSRAHDIRSGPAVSRMSLDLQKMPVMIRLDNSLNHIIPLPFLRSEDQAVRFLQVFPHMLSS